MSNVEPELIFTTEPISIGFSQSPEGRPCIGMQIGDAKWILYANRAALMADRIRTQLLEEFQVRSLPGLPIHVRESLARRTLMIMERNKTGDNPVGIYIPETDYDKTSAADF